VVILIFQNVYTDSSPAAAGHHQVKLGFG